MHFKRFLRELDLEQDSVFGMPNKNCTFEAFAWDAVGQSYIIFHAFALFFLFFPVMLSVINNQNNFYLLSQLLYPYHFLIHLRHNRNEICYLVLPSSPKL